MEAQTKNEYLTTHHFVRDVVRHPAFKDFGELMLPREDDAGYFDTRLSQVGSLMPYHGHVNADVVVGALNHLIDEAGAGRTVFYDFYTERQKQEDATKNRNAGHGFGLGVGTDAEGWVGHAVEFWGKYLPG